jgi:hypothetical protein
VGQAGADQVAFAERPPADGGAGRRQTGSAQLTSSAGVPICPLAKVNLGSAVPAAYRVALEELATACREACALAEVLDYAASPLRGRSPDPEESPADLFAAAGRLRQALARLDRARWAARDAWDALAPGDQEGLPSPDELLEEPTP